jgi:hypothetical protein
MVDKCPFLLEALTWVNNNTFIFQQHLKVSCFGLRVGVWLMARLIFPTFQFFSQHFKHNLDDHIIQLQASSNVCAHTPLISWVSTFYVAPMVMNAWEAMMQFVTFLFPLHKMQAFM